jgi:hypothetical protein
LVTAIRPRLKSIKTRLSSNAPVPKKPSVAKRFRCHRFPRARRVALRPTELHTNGCISSDTLLITSTDPCQSFSVNRDWPYRRYTGCPLRALLCDDPLMASVGHTLLCDESRMLSRNERKAIDLGRDTSTGEER